MSGPGSPATSGGAPEEPAAAPDEERLHLPVSRVLGASLGSVTVALVGSRVGIAGTLAGAALAPVLIMGGAYVSELSARRSRPVRQRLAPGEQLTTRLRARSSEASSAADAGRRPWWRRTTPRGIALTLAAAAVAFAIGLAAITLLESATGRPISSIGSDNPDSGTTLRPGSSEEPGQPGAPTPEPSKTPEPDAQPKDGPAPAAPKSAEPDSDEPAPAPQDDSAEQPSP
ncbi:MAG: hypothetical protein ACR2NA_11265 [Solirubrobacterales bacterium]